MKTKLGKYLRSSLPMSCTTQQDIIDVIDFDKIHKTRDPILYGLNILNDIVTSYNDVSLTEDDVLKRFRERIRKDMRAIFGEIYNLLIELSAEHYESNSVSDMALTVMSSQQIENFKSDIVRVDVKTDIGLNDIRALRKAINITEINSESASPSKICLILELLPTEGKNDFKIHGFINREILINIHPIIYLIGKLRWAVEFPQLNNEFLDVPIEERCAFRFDKNRILLPKVSVVEHKCKLIAENLIEVGIEDKKAKEISENIEKIIKIARKQKHGTGTIFLPKVLADYEQNRFFDNRRTYKTNFNIDSKDSFGALYSLTNIDGVTIIDYENNNCVGFGAILDGRIKSEGRSDRGARFNSIKTYLENLSFEKGSDLAIGLVVSEDKTIDVLLRSSKDYKARIL